MDTLRDSSRSFRATYAMLAATVTILSAGILAANPSKAASAEAELVANSEPARSFSLKEWELLAK